MTQADIRFGEVQAMLLDVAQTFATARSVADPVRAVAVSERGYTAANWQGMVDLGWPGLCIAETYGGSGLDLGHAVPVMEALGRRLVASPLGATLAAADLVQAFGAPSLKADLLPNLAEGAIATLALSEPGGGWNYARPVSTATPDGAFYRLQGVKRFVPWADSAEFVIVSVCCEGKLRLAAVPRSLIAPAALEREVAVDETQRTFRLVLDGIRLEPGWLLPESGEAPLDRVLRAATLLTCAEMSGGVTGAVDLIVSYLKVRKQFGKPIGAFQGLKHPTAEIFAHGEMARSLVYAAASHFDAPLGWRLTRMAKAKLSDLFVHAGDRAVQFHGGMGFSYECDAGLLLRRALWTRSQWGDGSHHRKALETEVFADAAP